MWAARQPTCLFHSQCSNVLLKKCFPECTPTSKNTANIFLQNMRHDSTTNQTKWQPNELKIVVWMRIQAECDGNKWVENPSSRLSLAGVGGPYTINGRPMAMLMTSLLLECASSILPWTQGKHFRPERSRASLCWLGGTTQRGQPSMIMQKRRWLYYAFEYSALVGTT